MSPKKSIKHTGWGNRCYAAEHQARFATKTLRTRPLLSQIETRKLVELILSDDDWPGPKKVQLQFNKRPNGNATAYLGRDRITFPKQVDRWIVIHEMAHHSAYAISKSNSGHGAGFRREYLRLLRRYDQSFARHLTKAFDDYGIGVDA